MRKIYLVLFLFFLVFLGFIFYSSNSDKNNVHEITFTQNGVDPSKITIKKGELVSFRSDGNEVFWPASDFHPSHLIYPEFDSKGPVENSKTWSFKFSKSGTWRFHDHLNPQSKGVVVVGNAFLADLINNAKNILSDSIIKLSGKDKYFDSVVASCSKQGTFEETRGCWEKALINTDNNFGTASAFDLIEKGISSDKNLRGTCHYYTEFVGFLAYERLSKGEKPVVFEKADMCGYGFYHAFMQEWISHTKDISAANSYCENAKDEKYGKENCVLGIGLGITFSNVTFGYLKDDLVIAKSLEMCNSLYKSDFENSYLCSEGVLSGLAHLYFSDHGLSLKINSSNPFWVCETLSNDLKNRCYPAITEVVFSDSNQDFEKISKFIFSLKSDRYRSESFERLGTVLFNSVYFKKGDEIKTHELCRSINDSSSRNACLLGFIRRYVSVEVRSANAIEDKIKVCDKVSFSDFEMRLCKAELNIFLKNNEQGF